MNMNERCTSPIPCSRTRRCRYKGIDSHEPVSKCARLSDVSSSDAGYLSNSPGSPLCSAPLSCSPTCQGLSRICQFLLLPIAGRGEVQNALNIHTGDEFVCKVFDVACYQQKMRSHSVLATHRNISQIRDIILGDRKAYVFFDKDFGDMHTFAKSCKRLGEERASGLFYQAVSAVAHCHQGSVVLGDLKLRKFVFSDEKRTHLRLESLEDSHVLRGDDDSVRDRRGCPAYVSPEVLSGSSSYSGRAADMWSLGVMLYTLLVGRYPFHDTEPAALFSKIRRGQYCLPEDLSPEARCLLRGLLRREPLERLTAAEVLLHPWFLGARETGGSGHQLGSTDQTVPTFDLESGEPLFC